MNYLIFMKPDILSKEELEKIKDTLKPQEYLKLLQRIEEIELQIQNMIFEGGPAFDEEN